MWGELGSQVGVGRYVPALMSMVVPNFFVSAGEVGVRCLRFNEMDRTDKYVM